MRLRIVAALGPARSEATLPDPMTDYERFPFTVDGISHPVYRRGSGPGILLMHELPGMTPQCLALADRIRARGFHVYLPLLFGEPGEDAGGRRAVSICLRHEFSCLAGNESSPITGWLRALAARIFEECGGPGIGAIGMCFTGNFVLSLMIEPHVIAPITSQPALPLLAFTDARKAALAVSPDELQAAKQRTSAGMSLLGFRFSKDSICPKERFQRLRQEFGPAFEGIEIDSSPGNRHGISTGAHSVLTGQFVDHPDHPTYQALQKALAFLEARLKPGTSKP